MISFVVRGVPAPQGSKSYLGQTHSGKARFRESSKRVAPWRSDVRDAALAELERKGVDGLVTGAVNVKIAFRLPRPKGHHGARGIRPSAPLRPTSKPDLDKLTRAVLDALTGLVLADDSQVVGLIVSKVYDDGEPAGATVWVEEVPS